MRALPRHGFTFAVYGFVVGELCDVGMQTPHPRTYQVLRRTSFRGKGHQSLLVSKLTGVAQMLRSPVPMTQQSDCCNLMAFAPPPIFLFLSFQ